MVAINLLPVIARVAGAGVIRPVTWQPAQTLSTGLALAFGKRGRPLGLALGLSGQRNERE